jgi:GTP-binding protein
VKSKGLICNCGSRLFSYTTQKDGDRFKTRKYSFVDRIRVRGKGGTGGRGCVSQESLGPNRMIPNGGHGGEGGNVIIQADKRVQSLSFPTHHFNGEHGKNGKSNQKHGRKGKDMILRVPCGTVVKEVIRESDMEDDWDGTFQAYTDVAAEYASKSDSIVNDSVYTVADLDNDGAVFVAAKGGKNGMGNCVLRGKALRTMPVHKINGHIGEEVFLELELKTIAQVGLVGYPNAGKSTFLSAVSKAQPTIASYAFTTLHPSVGHVEFKDTFRMTIADIPGLIDGAHKNVGLGHSFLRHIERTKVLLYLLDGVGTEGRDPWTDLEHLQRELELYCPNLTSRPSLVLANKMDLGAAEGRESDGWGADGERSSEEGDAEEKRLLDFQTALTILRHKTSVPVLPISAKNQLGLDAALQALRFLVEQQEQ